uniref:Uncharacterized protein n=1 Tax=Anguilla anguilla TaxID=7936 RepID=A0A0E9V4M1_ANGAN
MKIYLTKQLTLVLLHLFPIYFC